MDEGEKGMREGGREREEGEGEVDKEGGSGREEGEGEVDEGGVRREGAGERRGGWQRMSASLCREVVAVTHGSWLISGDQAAVCRLDFNTQPALAPHCLQIITGKPNEASL